MANESNASGLPYHVPDRVHGLLCPPESQGIGHGSCFGQWDVYRCDSHTQRAVCALGLLPLEPRLLPWTRGRVTREAELSHPAKVSLHPPTASWALDMLVSPARPQSCLASKCFADHCSVLGGCFATCTTVAVHDGHTTGKGPPWTRRETFAHTVLLTPTTTSR